MEDKLNNTPDEKEQTEWKERYDRYHEDRKYTRGIQCDAAP